MTDVSLEQVKALLTQTIQEGADRMIQVVNAYLTSAVPSTPPPVAGYAGWWDASDAASITESGGAVSQWDDKSGNGHHLTQATANRKPTTGTRTLNGLNVIDFDGASGSGDYMDSNAVSLNQPNTILVVVKYDDLSGDLGIVVEGATASHRNLLYATASPKVWGLYAGAGLNSSTQPGTATPHQVSALFNGASSQIWQDAVSVATGDAGSQDLGTLRVGQDLSLSAGGCLDGYIAELIVYPSALSTTDRQSVEAYLKAKWGTP